MYSKTRKLKVIYPVWYTTQRKLGEDLIITTCQLKNYLERVVNVHFWAYCQNRTSSGLHVVLIFFSGICGHSPAPCGLIGVPERSAEQLLVPFSLYRREQVVSEHTWQAWKSLEGCGTLYAVQWFPHSTELNRLLCLYFFLFLMKFSAHHTVKAWISSQYELSSFFVI